MSFLFSELGQLIAGALAAVATIWGVWVAGKRKGSQEAAQKAQKADMDRAREIERSADEIRRRNANRSPDERLREHGGFRDGEDNL